MEQFNSCPICNEKVPFSSRYPHYVCERCSVNAVDENGQSLKFWNVSISGGFEARYTETNKIRNSHVCYISGIKCWADESRFGGIIIQKLDKSLLEEICLFYDVESIQDKQITYKDFIVDNPWLELTSSSEKILSSDKSHIMLFNRDYCKLNDHKIMTNLLPEPFYGNVNAHIYLLALNPGYSEGEEEWHQDNKFLQALKLNLSHSYQKYPNYFFNPEFASHPGSKWWKGKTRWFLQDLPQEKREVVLSNNLFCVEYFPYHSKRFKKLPSKILGKEISDRDKYTIYLLKKR